MAPTALITISGVMRPRSCSVNDQSIISWSNGSRLRVRAGKLLPLVTKYRDLSLSHSLSCFRSRLDSSPGVRRKSRVGLQFDKPVVAKIDGNNKESCTHLRMKGKQSSRKRLSLRLRPRLRLLSYRLKRAAIRDLIEDAATMMRRNSKRVTLSTLVSFVLAVCFLLLKCTAVPASKVVPYSDLILNLQSGRVSTVLFEEGSRRIYFNMHSDSHDNSKSIVDASLATDVAYGSTSRSPENIVTAGGRRASSIPKWQYSTRKIDHDENFLLGLMREKGTSYSSAPQSVLMSVRNILITVISLWIPLTPLMWLLYRQLSAANSPAKKRRPSNQSVSFDDVEGVDAAKEELMEVVSCLQGSINYNKLGAKLPRGVLLVGPPGTGKTLLARAVAGEAGVPFFSVSASEFVELFVGRGAARIRDLFNVAKKCAPSLVFIDELDAVGGKRGRSFNDERDQTLNQLLTEMDGFESDTKVIVIAATNRPEALDPALCRPGRFSRKVLVGEPDLDGRKKILSVHLRGIPVEEEPQIICNLIASLTPGFVGADLANIVNEAALLAARRGGEIVTREDIMEAIERAKYGIKDSRLTPSALSKGLGKLFPWMPSFVGRDGPRDDGLQGVMGYHTLS